MLSCLSKASQCFCPRAFRDFGSYIDLLYKLLISPLFSCNWHCSSSTVISQTYTIPYIAKYLCSYVFLRVGTAKLFAHNKIKKCGASSPKDVCPIGKLLVNS